MQHASESLDIACVRGVPAGTKDLELHLAPPGTVELAVRGSPEIQIRDLAGLEPGPESYPLQFENDRPMWTARPANGGLVIEGLAPGEYWLLAADSLGGSAARTRIRVETTSTTWAEFVLHPATRLTLRVLKELEPIVVRAEDGFAWRLKPGWVLTAGGYTEVGEVLPAGKAGNPLPSTRRLALRRLRTAPGSRLAVRDS